MGIRSTFFHAALRHTCGNWLIVAGKPIMAVSEIILPPICETCQRILLGSSAPTFQGDRMSDKGEAFVKGGCGCLLAFLAIGMFFVLIGGSMHIDPGGVVLLFLIGGVVGLVVLAIYNQGRKSRDHDIRYEDDKKNYF